jgi:signal transduction histidine kinase
MRKGLFVFSVNVVSLREQPATQVAYFAYARPMADPRVAGAGAHAWGPRCASQHRPELLQRVAGDLSHDINNALFVVMGMLESLEDEFSQVDGLQASIVQVMSSAQRAANLNANIGRLTTGARRNYLAVELDALLTAVVPRMTMMLPATLAPHMHWNAPGARVLCSAGEIEEIVLQLLLNAMEAVGSARGTVELATEARSTGSCDWVCLSVRDTGSGIRPETQGQVFDPFYSTKGKPGLGLTIVRVLTKSLGGRVEVRSGSGLGTEVVVHLPVHTPAEAEKPDLAPAAEALSHGIPAGRH